MRGLEVSRAWRGTMLKRINKVSKMLGNLALFVARTSDAALEANRARPTALVAGNTLELMVTTGL